MKNLDRVMRVIYRQIAINEIFRKNQKINKDFDLNNDEFIQEIVKNYTKIYHDNYNEDEIKLILKKIKQNIQISLDLSNDDKIDALYIFVFVAKELFSIKNQNIQIKFELLFEWDGFASKIDTIPFYSAYISTKEIMFENRMFEFVHDNERIYNSLSKGLYETHMHLNGSGYSWELNWKKIACSQPLKSLKFEKKINNNKFSKYDDLNFTFFKIQALRLYLVGIVCGKFDVLNSVNIRKILAASSELEIYIFSDELDLLFNYSLEFFKCNNGNIHETYLNEQKLMTSLFNLFSNKKLNDESRYYFNIYIGIVSEIKFCFVQDNIGMGFTKFKESENIKDIFINHKDNMLVINSVFDKYYSELFVKGIEMRIAPQGQKKILEIIKNIDNANNEIYKLHKKMNSGKIKVGLIVHYIKQDDFSCTSNECRHNKLRESLKKQSKALNKYLNSINTSYEKSTVNVVGIDAANSEIFCPPEVFATVFRQHRQIIEPSQKFGFTYHVGEDFLNIASGLRSIDEVLEFMCFQRGDRLGHAIALGIDIDNYFNKKRKYIINTLQAFVDDIAWMHHLLKNIQTDKLYLRKYLEDEFVEYAEQLYKNTKIKTPSIFDYQQSWILRADDPDKLNCYHNNKHCFLGEKYYLNNDSELHKIAIESNNARLLTIAYHYNSAIKINGAMSIVIEVKNSFCEAIINSQSILMKKIYNKGIVVETNPTSNKKISFISHYDELPLLKFNQHRLTNPNDDDLKTKNDLTVTINTDDSAIFQTNLSNEYSLVALSLIKKGYSKEEVYNYIDYLRDISCQTTFIEK